jgi:hypothetical protein
LEAIDMTGMSDSSSMSEQVQMLIRAFDRLSEGEQREFAVEVLRRTRDLQWPPLDDETIDRIADESFVEYDIREAADAHG